MGVCNWVGVGAEWVPIVKGCTRWKQQMGVYEWVGTGAERVPLSVAGAADDSGCG